MSDLISRKKLDDAITELYNCFQYPDQHIFDMVSECISECPAVNAVDVRRGKWIQHKSTFEQYEPSICECSECHKSIQGIYGTPYCSNCGAKMGGHLERS